MSINISFPPQQPKVSDCVISPSTRRLWKMFPLFREHRKDFEFITEPLPQMAELLMGGLQMVISVQRGLTKYIYIFEDNFRFGASEDEACESCCARFSETDSWITSLVCVLHVPHKSVQSFSVASAILHFICVSYTQTVYSKIYFLGFFCPCTSLQCLSQD